MKKLVSIFKFCYKFIFQFVATTLLGFGIYKGDDLKEKYKEEQLIREVELTYENQTHTSIPNIDFI